MNQDQEINIKYQENIMDFKNINWSEEDFSNYRKYLLTYKNTEDKINWRKTIVKTEMPMLAIYQKDIVAITKKILKSNVLNYLNNVDFKYYEETLIYGNVLSSLKYYPMFYKFINMFVDKIDNWSTVDNIRFNNIYKTDKEELFNLSSKYLVDERPFVRRTAVLILFVYINDENYEQSIFNKLNDLVNENDYYVNMAASWLLCELFVKSRNNALKYYSNHQTNKFIINKSIQKCRDSFRVSKEDKEMLLDFKVV